jgi:hypothetical protein
MPPPHYSFAGPAPEGLRGAPAAASLAAPPGPEPGRQRTNAGPAPVAFAAGAGAAGCAAVMSTADAARDPHVWTNAGPAPEALRPGGAF